MTTAAQINEDEIIKKRLIIEGDSGNEDRIINKLIRQFIKWCNNKDKAEEHNEDFEMIMALLSHIEFGLLRNHLIQEMNKLEQDNYEELYKKVNEEIEKAKVTIVQTKIELQEAKKIRKNRQEYDVLAKEINKYKDRQEMMDTIESLEKRLELLNETKNDLYKKIELRRKQFTVLFKSINNLKSLIETEQFGEHDTQGDLPNNLINENAVSPLDEFQRMSNGSRRSSSSKRQENLPSDFEDDDEEKDDDLIKNIHSKMDVEEEETSKSGEDKVLPLDEESGSVPTPKEEPIIMEFEDN